MMFSFSWPGDPCRSRPFQRVLVRLCTGLRGLSGASCLQTGPRHGTRIFYPTKSPEPITYFCQCLTRVAELAGEVSHALADGMHAIGHVPVNGHQLPAELPEQVCLLCMAMEKLAIGAGEGRAPGAGVRGPAGRGGAWGWTAQFLPLAGSFRGLCRGRTAKEGGPGERTDTCTSPLQRRKVVLLGRAWHLFIFISLNRRGSMNYQCEIPLNTGFCFRISQRKWKKGFPLPLVCQFRQACSFWCSTQHASAAMLASGWQA